MVAEGQPPVRVRELNTQPTAPLSGVCPGFCSRVMCHVGQPVGIGGPPCPGRAVPGPVMLRVCWEIDTRRSRAPGNKAGDHAVIRGLCPPPASAPNHPACRGRGVHRGFSFTIRFSFVQVLWDGLLPCRQARRFASYGHTLVRVFISLSALPGERVPPAPHDISNSQLLATIIISTVQLSWPLNFFFAATLTRRSGSTRCCSGRWPGPER